MNSKTRAISEGAMMLALMAIVLLIDRQSAGFFELMIYFFSVPVVIYEVRHGFKMAMALAISSMLLAFMFSTITGMFYVFIAVLVGVVYGYGIINDWSNQKLLFFAILMNILSTCITVVMFANVFGYDLQEEVKLMMEMFEGVSLPYLDMAKVILEIVLLSYLALAFLQAILTHLMSNMLLARLKLKYRKMNTIFDVKIPKFVGLLMLLAFVIYYVCANMVLAEWIQKAILAGYIVSLLLSITMGCISVTCFLRILGKGRLSFILCMFACMVPVLNYAIAAIGVLDLFLGLREKMKEGVLREIPRKN